MGRKGAWIQANGLNTHCWRRGTFPHILGPGTDGAQVLADSTLNWGQPNPAIAHTSPGPDSGPGCVQSIPLPAPLIEATHQFQRRFGGVGCYFTNEETEAQRGQGSCPGSHSQLVKAKLSRRPPHSSPLDPPAAGKGGSGAGGLTAWLSASPCRVSTPFTWSVLQHVGVRAVPAAALSHHLALPAGCPWLSQDGPGCPTAHPLDVGAEISLHGWALAVQYPRCPPSKQSIPLGSAQPGSPTAAKDEVLLLGRPLGACTRAWQSEAERGLLEGQRAVE